jgi:hypothetical protein
MTPAAITPAARGGTARAAAAGSATKKAPVPGHRRKLREQSRPSAPRRVSGPLRSGAAGATVPRPRPAPRRRSARAPLGARFLAFVRALPDHSLLDRVVRGRAWILMLGVMLAGIVAMQVEVLKLGASMGRSIQASTGLQSRNELLRASVASLADDQRIERLAAGMGMIMPAPDGVGFLAAHPRPNVQQALGNIHAPNADSFLSLITANGTVTTGSSTNQLAGTASSSTSSSTSTSTSTATSSAQATAVSTAGSTAPTQSTPSQSTPTQSTPTQSAPTQSTPSQTGGTASGGAGIPTGG